MYCFDIPKACAVRIARLLKAKTKVSFRASALVLCKASVQARV